MTVKTRISFYYIMFFCILAAGIISLVVSAIVLLPANSLGDSIISQFDFIGTPGMDTSEFWMSTMESPARLAAYMPQFIIPALLYVPSVVFSALFMRHFRKVTASHLLFLCMYLLSLCWGLIRLLEIFLYQLQADSGLLLSLARLELITFLLGIFSVFLISLQMVGVKFQHQGTFAVLITGISVILGYLVPFRYTSSGPLAYQMADTQPLFLVSLAIAGIAVIGFVYYIWDVFTREGTVRSLGAASIIVGHILMYFSATLSLSIIALALICLGLVVYFVRLFYDFFWY